MRRWTPWMLALSLAVGLPATGAAMVQVGQVAPDFELTDVDGLKYKLSDYRGQLVVLAFIGYG